MPNHRRKNGPPRPAGMGDPMQSRYYDQGYRDYGQGEPPTPDMIYDPRVDPNNIPPDVRDRNEQMFEEFYGLLKKQVVFVKAPAFAERPFFSFPKIKVGRLTLAANGGTGVVLHREVAARQRAIVTAIGIDTDNPALVDQERVYFWFTINGTIYPLFDDNTIVTPPHPVPPGFASPIDGQTTIFPGSIENPFCLESNDIYFRVEGPAIVRFHAVNWGAVSIRIRALMGYYQYWMPNNAEFADGELQL